MLDSNSKGGMGDGARLAHFQDGAGRRRGKVGVEEHKLRNEMR